jgi:hypothetical protein
MQAKNVLYATVGAPVVAARRVGEGVTALRGKISEGTSGYGQAAEKAIDSWAIEGEKVVARLTDGKVVDEITAKVDLDQAKEQVSKLRDQLEDMLATWRASFRPEKLPSVRIEASTAGVKVETQKTGGRKAAGRKTAAKKAASGKTVAKKASAKVTKTAKKAAGTTAATSKSPSAKKASPRKAPAKKASSTATRTVAVAS